MAYLKTQRKTNFIQDIKAWLDSYNEIPTVTLNIKQMDINATLKIRGRCKLYIKSNYKVFYVIDKSHKSKFVNRVAWLTSLFFKPKVTFTGGEIIIEEDNFLEMTGRLRVYVSAALIRRHLVSI